jgi:hypothetical protein
MGWVTFRSSCSRKYEQQPQLEIAILGISDNINTKQTQHVIRPVWTCNTSTADIGQFPTGKAGCGTGFSSLDYFFTDISSLFAFGLGNFRNS